MPNRTPCGLQYCLQLVRVVIKKDDVLNVVTINISYMSCLPDVIRRTEVRQEVRTGGLIDYGL
jgi:hypothetical protein